MYFVGGLDVYWSLGLLFSSVQSYWRAVFKAAGRQAEMRAFARAMLPAAERRRIRPLSEEVRPAYESWERAVQTRLHATTLAATIRPVAPAPVARVGEPVARASAPEPEVAPANHLSNVDVNIFADRPTVRPEPCQHCGMCRPMEWDGRPRGGWEAEERRREIEAQRRCVCNSRNEMELEAKVAAERSRKEKEEFAASGWEKAEAREGRLEVRELKVARKEQDDRDRVRRDQIRHDRELRRMGQRGCLDWQGSTPAWLTHPPTRRPDEEIEAENQWWTANQLRRQEASRHEAVALANVREDIWEEEEASGVGVERSGRQELVMRPRVIDVEGRNVSPPEPKGEECMIVGEVSAELGAKHQAARVASREEIARLWDEQKKLEGVIRRLKRENEKAVDRKRKREDERAVDRKRKREDEKAVDRKRKKEDERAVDRKRKREYPERRDRVELGGKSRRRN